MIKKILGSILLICLILVIILSIKEAILDNPINILRKIPDGNWNVFTEGKELVFLVKYLGIIPVGLAKMKLEGLVTYNARKVYKLVAKAGTAGFISSLYKAKAEVSSYMDKDKLYSLRYTENLILPDKETEIKEIIYDQDNLIMTRGKTRVKILPNTQDPLSAFFYLRAQDLDLNKSFNINTITKEDNYRLGVEVVKKIEGVWLLKSTLERQNKTRSGGVFYIYLSDDQRRLPLLVKAWTKAGLVTIRLIEIK